MTKYPLPEPPHEEEVDSGLGMDMEVLVILLYKISAAPPYILIPGYRCQPNFSSSDPISQLTSSWAPDAHGPFKG